MLKLLGHLRSLFVSPQGPTRVDVRSTGAKAAIVFLHGFGGDILTTWGQFPALIAADVTLSSWDIFCLGYPTSLRLDLPLWSRDPNLTLLAEELCWRLESWPLKHYESIALVAHSMGGLVAQRAVLDSQSSMRIGHLFLFGTPSAGLGKAAAGAMLKRQAWDMNSESEFIKTLRSEWTERFRYHRSFHLRVIAGDRDDFVPAASSLKPFDSDARAVVPGDHLQIVKPTNAKSESVTLLRDALLAPLQVRRVVESARLAVEERRFAQAIEVLMPRVEQLDDAARVQLALALESAGRGSEALRCLERFYQGGSTYTDAVGALAGRLKRRWLVERRREDWIRSRELYSAALEQAVSASDPDQAIYLGINVTFLDLMMLPPASAISQTIVASAQKVLAWCEGAKPGFWRLATEGEANAIIGNIAAASRCYEAALELKPSPREVDSMYKQAALVFGRVFDEPGQSRVERIFGYVE